MNLSRPDLGSVTPGANVPQHPYRIAGVGVLFGGMFYDLFSNYDYEEAPGIYIFHQPNDLIVPNTRNRLFLGYNACAVATGCVNISDRPMTYGGSGINSLIEELELPLDKKPEVLFETTSNTADCLAQVFNPSSGGHQMDSFNNRTRNMATFFTNLIQSDCPLLGISRPAVSANRSIAYPNPANHSVAFSNISMGTRLKIMDALGNTVLQMENIKDSAPVDISALPGGFYHVELWNENHVETHKLLKNW